MRLRNISGSREIIGKSEFVVHGAEGKKGNWPGIFGNNNPIHIEIGMGKGRFLMDMAKAHPDINYVGIEKYSSVLLRAIQKMEKEREPLPNVRFIRMDAESVTDVFDREEVGRIYLNFSDPWPKDRHAKRRLTSRTFLARYDKILKSEGRLEFKTDNRELFDFSVEELAAAGWKAESISYDLHNDPILMKDNIMTEYEERFSSMGNPICNYSIYRERKVHERKDKKSEIEKD